VNTTKQVVGLFLLVISHLISGSGFASQGITFNKISEVSIGHYLNGICVSNGLVSCAAKSDGLFIIDISDITNPYVTGNVDTPGRAMAVSASNGYAFVADYDSGTQVINISNPVSPQIISSFPLYLTLGISVYEESAFVVNKSGTLQILDISIPYSPTLLGSCSGLGLSESVFISGSIAYVAGHSSGLKIVNIDDMSEPFLLSTLKTTGYVEAAYVQGNLAYIADGSSGFMIVDVSSPSNPIKISSCDTPGWATDIVVSDNLAFVADEPGGLQVIDVSDVYSPRIINNYETPGEVMDISLLGDYLFLADGNSGKLIILEIKKDDIAVPTPPKNLTAQSTDVNSIRLAWDESIDDTAVVRYDVFRVGAPSAFGDTYTKIGSSTSTSYTLIDVNSGEEYCFVVQAVDPYEKRSEFSNKVCLITAPSAPENLWVSSIGPGYIQLAWSPPSNHTGLDHYIVALVNTSSPFGPSYTAIGSTSNPTYKVTGLEPGQYYCFVVKCVSTSGDESSFSDNFACSEFLAGSDFTDALLIPHIATSWGWGTKLIIDNSDPEPRNATVTIYKDGEQLSEETHEIPANSSQAIPITDGDCGFVQLDGTNVSARVSYIHSEEEGIAEFQLTDFNYNQLTYTMPQYLAGKLTWMGLAVMNPTNQETQVQFTAIGSDGTALGTASVDLPAYTRKASVLSSLFESVPFSSIAQVIAQSDTPICGINISGIENRQLLFTQATGTDPQPRTLYLPHIANTFPTGKTTWYLTIPETLIPRHPSPFTRKAPSPCRISMCSYPHTVPLH